MKQEEKEYAYWLASVEGMGYHSYCELEQAGVTPKQVYEMTLTQLSELQKDGILKKRVIDNLLQKQNIDPKDNLEALTQRGIKVVLPMEENYPVRLKKIPDPPLTLYYRNNLPKEEEICVAIVGARECTEYGRFVADELGKTLAKHGIQLISGLARGIDGISQRSAIKQNGAVFAVLGSGVDVCYPKSNIDLHEQMWNSETCGILSEYPIGTKPRASLFPPRNRIISGLSDVLVVVEARIRSGTFITVDAALEQGKEVYAVPGRATDRHSDGCNRLIKDGAGVLLSPEEFVMELMQNFYGIKEKMRSGQWGIPIENVWNWNEKEKMIYDILDVIPKTMEQIRGETGLFPEEVMEILVRMELKNAVKRIGNCYVKIIKNKG